MSCSLAVPLQTARAAEDAPLVSAFSSTPPGALFPQGWQPLQLGRNIAPTRYAMVDDNGRTVLRADAVRSASALTFRTRSPTSDWPILRWSWKIAGMVAGSTAGTRDGDDYPVRLYVSFDLPLEKLSLADRTRLRLARMLHGADLPAATLCYVWDSRTPPGTIIASAYTDRVRMVVVESGSLRIGQWVNYERDIAADYRAAFGEEPPPISSVTVASDTDNTGESVTAYFGDISLHKRAVRP